MCAMQLNAVEASVDRASRRVTECFDDVLNFVMRQSNGRVPTLVEQTGRYFHRAGANDPPVRTSSGTALLPA